MSFRCRICENEQVLPVLSLGTTPLANSLLSKEQLQQPEDVYPLDLVLCPNCSLVQITEDVSPEVLFRDYFYFSSFSEAMLQSVHELALRLIAQKGLNADSLALEVGSNDGYLLQYYKQNGVPVLGIEPARNIAEVARTTRDIPTISEFFGAEIAQQLADEGKYADVIHINNVLAHVSSLKSIAQGLGILLKPEGTLVVEVPYVKDMIDNVEFDTIYHEHLCYFSLTALEYLFRQHGLFVQDVELIPLHGGSLRVFLGKQDVTGPRAQKLLDEEKAWGVFSIDYYHDFARRVENLKVSLINLLSDIKAKGQRVAAYGAAAKGSTLLNYCDVGQQYLDYVVDRNTYKQGHYMPGVHLPIYDPAKLAEDMPDYVLILSWNFAPEIFRQQNSYREKGGQFIIPVPEAHIVEEVQG